MKRIRAFVRLIFGFSSTETNAFLVLLPLMLIVIASEPVYQTYFMSNDPDDLEDRAELDSIVATWVWPEEEKKKPYKNDKISSRRPYKSKTFPKPKARQKEKFDLNLADTTQLKSIYGIGSKLAGRIIAYRTNLGGFVAHYQLYEIWGLDSTVVSRLSEKSVIAPGFTPNQLQINRCSEQDLSRHPYIRTKLALAIVNYRLLHGAFSSVDDLKKINIMEEKVFLRIKPYINLD